MLRSVRRPTAALALAVSAALAMYGCAGKHTAAPSSTASGASDAFAVTAEQACTNATTKENGQFNYWTSTDPNVFQKEIQPFQQKYPGIKINYTSLRPSDQVQRVVAEIQAHHDLDVDAIAGDLPSFSPLFSQGQIQKVDWQKLGIPADDVFTLNGIPAPRTYRTLLGLGYNNKLVSESDLPSTWQDLVNSKWSGKVVVDPRGIYLSGVSLSMGKDQAVSWFKDFMAQDKPIVVQGATASMQKVISGEAQLTTSSHDSETAEQQSKGAPVAIKYLDIVPTQDWYAAIIKGAPHPNAAACFFSWWLSPEGQDQQFKYEFRKNDTKPAGVPASAKFVSINDPEQAKLATDVATEFAKVMGK
jgi:iron(III) transport system substrate-binding protein